ncbi:lipase [Leptospira sp. 96542]|nr:lipase [Leptospira sp. 96542]
MSIQRKLWVIFFSFPLFLLSIEGILRFFNPPALRYYRDVKLLHAYHPEYGVTLAPNQKRYVRHYADLWQGQFTTNSLGMRSTVEPDPEKPKLLCLGDSLVMGFGVSDNETFCSLLDGVKIGGDTLQSLNIGVDAYGSLGSLKRLLDMSHKITNIKEVLFFISPNDYTMPEELRAQGILPDDENDALHENDQEYKKNFKLQFELTRVSYLLQALKLAYEQTKVKYAQTKYLIQTDVSEFSNSPYNYLANTFFLSIKPKHCENAPENFICPQKIENLNVVCLDSPIDPNSLPKLTKTTTNAYDKMIELANRKNFRLRPVILPMQIEEVYCRNIGKYNKLGSYAIQAKLYWEKKGIKPIELLPHTASMCGRTFEKQGKTFKAGIQDYYIPGDGHLTELGNLWAAESIILEISKENQ